MEEQFCLTQFLGLRYGHEFQDWEIINADPERVQEFLNIHHEKELSKRQKCEIVELILHSLDKKYSLHMQGIEVQSVDELNREFDQLVSILRSNLPDYGYIINRVLGWRGNVLEEEVADYLPILPLFEKEFANFSSDAD